jgi:Acetyl-CoA dehydrogenase C-terminal like
MMSETTVGWMLLEGAAIAIEKKKTVAAGHPDAAFYDGKISAAIYYARNVLPGVELKARLMGDEDKSPLEIADAAFATV